MLLVDLKALPNLLPVLLDDDGTDREGEIAEGYLPESGLAAGCIAFRYKHKNNILCFSGRIIFIK